jgi:hypothetical protein
MAGGDFSSFIARLFRPLAMLTVKLSTAASCFYQWNSASMANAEVEVRCDNFDFMGIFGSHA